MNLLSEEKDSVGGYDKVDIVIGNVPSSPKFIQNNRLPKPFSLPQDTFKNRLRPERQFDVSNVLMSSKGLQPSQRSGINFSKLTKDFNKRLSGKLASDPAVFESLSSFYPQSSKWPTRLSSKATVENKGAQTTRSPSVLTSNPVAKPIENENNELLEALFTKLKDTLETLKKKENKNRKNITNLLNLSNDRSSGSEMTDPEIIYVNIWNNVNGELQLAERKHMSRKKFDEIESTKDFSQLINFNNDRNVLFNSPTQKSHFKQDHSVQVINKITIISAILNKYFRTF